MAALDVWFDGLLAVLILILAWRSLRAEQLYPAAILFIAFGLSMALAWTRLAAPDVALAEAAIGTGLLGVLLIDSLRVFTRDNEGREDDRTPREKPDLAARAGVVCTVTLLAVVLTAALAQLPKEGGLTAQAAEALDRSGVDHPVTAVLLNYRGYDTWLEIGVLLLAMFGIFCAGGRIGFAAENKDRTDRVIQRLVRALVPMMVLTGGYLLWLGKFAPGGAFQSGVVLGAAGIFLNLAGVPLLSRLPVTVWKTGLLLGFALFLAFGMVTWFAGNPFLAYPPAHAGGLILLVEAAAAVSIGFTLAAFFVYLTTTDREAPANPQRQTAES